ncbi:DUF3871 family protein [Flavobacterium sp. I3-2]|uniref:DUF3871 family protein n=1 Tax=Flavobacterium sp. I3-2 TaxID=2748319 RepID=UPI0015A822ED|nr:DUF3871 family protein [Flavobacterium sp. I3-2]
MELVVSNQTNQVIEDSKIVNTSKTKFIEANTIEVSLSHLKEDCIIPVFAKDNETTISHTEFILAVKDALHSILGNNVELVPNIRVSHGIKGRIPSAIGKPAKELLEHEKTIYYERMAFVFEIPEISEVINGNRINLCVGGVRAYNQENLFTKKSIEKFKIFIGFQNTVCTNLCISTDGLLNDLRVSSTLELKEKVFELVKSYDRTSHLNSMRAMLNYSIEEEQFARLIGKMKMYNYQSKEVKKNLFPLAITDTQINSIVKDYHNDVDFMKEDDGTINLWNLYNLFTEANKSTYIDLNLERNVNAHDFINHLSKSLETNSYNWYTY